LGIQVDLRIILHRTDFRFSFRQFKLNKRSKLYGDLEDLPRNHIKKFYDQPDRCEDSVMSRLSDFEFWTCRLPCDLGIYRVVRDFGFR